MSFDALRRYVRETMPLLNDALGPLHKDEVRQVLNAATGLLITPASPIVESAAQFLDALKKHEARGTLTLVALPKALKVAAKLQKQH